MSVIAAARRPQPWEAWVLMLPVLAALWLKGPVVALILLVALAILRTRPLDFLLSYLVVMAGASFVDYTKGILTGELTLLTVAILFMLFCYAIRPGRPILALQRTPLTIPLVCYLLLSAVNFARGLVAGNSPHYAGLAVLAVLALGSALLVANGRYDTQDFRYILGWLIVVGLGHLLLGFYVFSITHVRVGMLSFAPVPGVLACLFLNLALRAPRLRDALRWGVVTVPMLVHQFMSFTRGYWLGIFGAFAWSVLLFVGRGPGAGRRLRRTSQVLGLVAALFIVGGVLSAALFGIRNLGEQAGKRLSSSASTEFTYEAGSNVIRLAEYVQVWDHIVRAPWFGHGLGYSFLIREPFELGLNEQWYTHDNYLLIWVQQGLLGLGLFLASMLGAARTGLRAARDPDPTRAAWGAGTAAAVVYLLIYMFVHFPLAEVNTIFLTALLWGISMSIVAREQIVVRWRVPAGVRRFGGAIPGTARATGAGMPPA